MMTREQVLKMKFKPMPHFTIAGSLTYELGRGRHLSIGAIGTPNEMVYICQMDKDNPKEITDLICLHNYDYDGYITEEKLRSLTEMTI